jgi:hypothetical protein
MCNYSTIWKQLKTCDYENSELGLLKWFRQNQH